MLEVEVKKIYILNMQVIRYISYANNIMIYISNLPHASHENEMLSKNQWKIYAVTTILTT